MAQTAKDVAKQWARVLIGTPATAGHPGAVADPKWIYAQLVRTEAHWTDQRQNQQARVATTMTVAGVMLTLLAPLVFDPEHSQLRLVHPILSLACLLLAVSLVFGVMALFPVVPPSQHRYIDPTYFTGLSLGDGDGNQVDRCVYDEVIKSFQKPGIRSLGWRRVSIICQLLLIAVAAVLLAVSFARVI